jgi:hypothetical protein
MNRMGKQEEAFKDKEAKEEEILLKHLTKEEEIHHRNLIKTEEEEIPLKNLKKKDNKMKFKTKNNRNKIK